MTIKKLLYWFIVCAFVAALLPAAPVQAVATEILKPGASAFSGEGADG